MARNRCHWDQLWGRLTYIIEQRSKFLHLACQGLGLMRAVRWLSLLSSGTFAAAVCPNVSWLNCCDSSLIMALCEHSSSEDSLSLIQGLLKLDANLKTFQDVATNSCKTRSGLNKKNTEREKHKHRKCNISRAFGSQRILLCSSVSKLEPLYFENSWDALRTKGGVEAHGRCWYLGAEGASCGQTCGSQDGQLKDLPEVAQVEMASIYEASLVQIIRVDVGRNKGWKGREDAWRNQKTKQFIEQMNTRTSEQASEWMNDIWQVVAWIDCRAVFGKTHTHTDTHTNRFKDKWMDCFLYPFARQLIQGFRTGHHSLELHQMILNKRATILSDIPCQESYSGNLPNWIV